MIAVKNLLCLAAEMPLKPLLPFFTDCMVELFIKLMLKHTQLLPNQIFASPFRQATTDLVLLVFPLFLEAVVEALIHQVV